MMKQSLLALTVLAALSGCSLDGDDGAQGPVGEVGAPGTPGDDGKNLPRELDIAVVGRFNTGIYGQSAAEIVQFHKASKSAFAINAAQNRIEVIPLSALPVTSVGSPVSDDSLTSTAFTFPDNVTVKNAAGSDITVNLGEANSIAIYADMLAIAVAAPLKTDNGAVLFYSLSATGVGTFVKAVSVGALPDMVTFTPDGSMLLVANEAEPESDYSVDPEGSVGIIAITAGVAADQATLLNFSAFNADQAKLKAQGVKFAAPVGTTVAQDLEPEYITVSSDSKKAFVSLQENNALAIVDLAGKEITKVVCPCNSLYSFTAMSSISFSEPTPLIFLFFTFLKYRLKVFIEGWIVLVNLSFKDLGERL